MKQKRAAEQEIEQNELGEEQENLDLTEEDLAEKSEALWYLQTQLEIDNWRYKALYDYAPDPYVLTDEQGVIQESNQAASDLFGIEKGLLRGRVLVEYIEPNEHAIFRSNLNRLRQEAERLEWEATLNLQSSGARYAAFSVSPVRNSHQKTIVLGWLIRDVTERRQAEEMRARLAAIVAASQDAILGYSTKGFLQSWNRGAEQIFGYSESEAVGRPLSLLASPEYAEEQREFIEAVLRGESIIDRETTLRRKDEAMFPASLTMAPIRTESGIVIGVSAIVHDITTRRQVEVERDRQRDLLAEQERRAAVLRERNRMAQEIHDGLAQTLLGISLQIEAVKDLPGIQKELLHCVERIQVSARSGLAEARRSVQALRPGLLEDHTLTEALLYIAVQATLGTGIKLVSELAAPLVPLAVEVEADLFRIAQEAVTNAVRHSKAGCIRVEMRGTERLVHLGIEDDGDGFDVSVPTGRYGILGIQERTKRLGGELKLVTAPGCGTKLTVTVPIEGFRIDPRAKGETEERKIYP